MAEKVPAWVAQDRYWRSVVHLFANNAKLQSVFTTKYINFDERTISITALKRKADGWSQSEKFMLNLALHLFNESNKVNLSDMDFLDDYNRKLVFEAIKLRFF